MPRFVANTEFYRLKCANLQDDTFKVVRFSGEEELSRLYRFELELVSPDPDVSLADMINQPAVLTMARGDDETPVAGIIAHAEQAGRSAHLYVYRAVLVPSLWRLTLSHQSRIFPPKKTAPEILKTVLDEAGITVEFKIRGSFQPIEYCVQYRESDFNFVSRMMEHYGIYYFFKHDEEKETLVLVGDRSAHDNLPGDHILLYDDAATLLGDREVVQNVVYREQVVTGKVVLKDYHYRTPDTDLKVESQLNSDMPGVYYDYGGHYADAGGGNTFAKVRNEEIESQRVQLSASSNCTGLHVGYKFDLEEHYRPSLNTSYLLTRVEHRGSQARAMGLGGVQQPREAAARLSSISDGTSNTVSVSENGASLEPEYENFLTCIPAQTQYRPARLTPVPQIPGIMTAKLESAGGDYAYVDDNGEYRAKMFYDLGGSSAGTNSLPIRMSQPYSGANYGMHFPNHAGTEVVFACIDGDVNRPLALGTVPNPNNGSPVKSDNKMQNVIRTMAGNEILLDDTKEKSQIQIKTTDGNSVLFDDKDDRIVIATEKKHTVTIDDKNENIEVKTKDGHVFLMDDKNKKMALTSKDGHILSISDQDKLMTIADKDGKNSFTIDIGKKKLIIKSEEGHIDILAPSGEIKMQAKKLSIKVDTDTLINTNNFEGKASSDWKTQATNITEKAQMELKQSGMNVTSEAQMKQTVKGGMDLMCEGGMNATVKAGAMLTVQSTGPNMVKGTPVMIN